MSNMLLTEFYPISKVFESILTSFVLRLCSFAKMLLVFVMMEFYSALMMFGFKLLKELLNALLLIA